MLEGQATHIAHVVNEVKAREAKSVEPTPEAEAEWVKIVTGPSFITDYQNTCRPATTTARGKTPSRVFLILNIRRVRWPFTKCSRTGANRIILKASWLNRSKSA